MIVFETPKGWTGPKEIDGRQVEGNWRSHQVPMAEVRTNATNRAILEQWLRSYRPEELFDADAATLKEVKRIPMRKPVGKYNVHNKVTRSAGTSH